MGGAGGRKFVLVVDDEVQVRRLVARMLQDMGCDVDSAADGGEAIAKIAARRPDLVILDVMMPGIDGFGVLDHLRGTSDPPPVVGLTALDDYETFSGFVRGGAAAFLCKPFRFHDLLQICDRVLHQAEKRGTPVAQERRREPRRELMVGVRVLSKERAPVALGEFVNLSPGGAQVSLVLSLDLGVRVRVAFHVSGGASPLSFDGRVQWRVQGPKGFTHGLAFVDLVPEAAARLRDLFRPPA